jgi:hypothetical protein
MTPILKMCFTFALAYALALASIVNYEKSFMTLIPGLQLMPLNMNLNPFNGKFKVSAA